MAETASENDKKRTRIEKLREQIASEQLKAANAQAEASAQVESVQLDTEIATLEGQLAAAKEATKAASKGGSSVLDQVTSQLEAAVALKDNPPGPVDPNAEVADEASEEKKG